MILSKKNLAIINEYDSIALVFCDVVVLDVDNWSHSQDSIIVTRYYIFGNQKLFTMSKQHTLPTGVTDVIIVNIVIDIIWTLQYQITVCATRYLIFLDKSSSSPSEMYSISKVFTHFIQKYVRMSVIFDLNSYFLVICNYVVKDLCSISATRNKDSSLNILWKKIEP
jgi:hypothetical protein